MHQYCSFVTAITRIRVQVRKWHQLSLAWEGCQVGHTNRLKDAFEKCQTGLQHFQWRVLWLRGRSSGGRTRPQTSGFGYRWERNLKAGVKADLYISRTCKQPLSSSMFILTTFSASDERYCYVCTGHRCLQNPQDPDLFPGRVKCHEVMDYCVSHVRYLVKNESLGKA